MSNDPAKLAYFAGLYKSVQSAGGAVAWSVDGLDTRRWLSFRLFGDLHILAYMNIFISTWVLLTVGLILAIPMVMVRVKEHTDFADETIARMDENGRVRDVPEVVEKAGELSKEGKAEGGL